MKILKTDNFPFKAPVIVLFKTENFTVITQYYKYLKGKFSFKVLHMR